MKNHISLILALIILTIFVSGCIGQEKVSEDLNTTVYSGNGVSFAYPDNWEEAESLDNHTLVSVADPGPKDPENGNSLISVSIQAKNLTESFDMFYFHNYESLFKNTSYKKLEEGNLSLKNYESKNIIYLLDKGSSVKKYRAVWIQNGNEVYVILCTAPEQSFNQYDKKFDSVINSFIITN